MDGRSLAPLLRGVRPGDWRTSFLIEYYTDTVFPRVLTMGYKAIRTERYKYIHYTDLEGMDELYDLKSDPYEMRNVIDDLAAQATLGQLKEELKTFLKDTP
jgi:N-acetylglucosamine-6-sulfatase